MTIKELQSWLRYIRKHNPDAKDYEIVVEPHSVWKNYHLSEGFAERHEGLKPAVVVWRLPAENNCNCILCHRLRELEERETNGHSVSAPEGLLQSRASVPVSGKDATGLLKPDAKKKQNRGRR